MKQKKNRIYLLTLLVITVFFALPLKAQVNIGSVEDPHQFSILELTTTKDSNGGLRMPQLNNDERAAVQEKFNENTATAEAAKGLIIYNTETGCLEFWNGKEWISLCSDILPPTPVLEVYPASITFDSNGNVTSPEQNKVTVTTNQTNWTATITYNQDSGWITGVPTSGTDGQQFTVTVASGAETVRTATITVTAGGVTRYVSVVQFPDNYTDSTAPTNFLPYVGAFWKANQTGERLIRIPRPTSGNADGAWTATVISGSDWITLDTQMTSDPNVGWLTGAVESNVDNGNDTGFDTKHAVVNGTNLVTGTMDATTPQIYFRIGLKSTIASADAAPRYGIVLFTYKDNSLSQRIFIRQGEAADYLMRSGDPIGDVNSITCGITTRSPSQCVQFSPYNLTAKDDQMNSSLDVNGGIWTAYPSQAGALFQWANTTNPRYAYNPTGNVTPWNNTSSPSGYWSTDYETCPIGYHRPSDGITNGNDSNDPPVTSSEMRQSLYLTPQRNAGNNDVSNSIGGYYADGFFDRRKITTSNSVSSGNQVAYIGRLFYNQYNNASLFFPFAGTRNGSGTLSSAGSNSQYWSSSSNTSSTSWNMVVSNTMAQQSNVSRYFGFSIRCVKNN